MATFPVDTLLQETEHDGPYTPPLVNHLEQLFNIVGGQLLVAFKAEKRIPIVRQPDGWLGGMDDDCNDGGVPRLFFCHLSCPGATIEIDRAILRDALWDVARNHDMHSNFCLPFVPRLDDGKPSPAQ